MDKNAINHKIKKTLESLDGIQRASPGPFFFTRLQVRLNRQTRSFWEEVGSFLTKPVVALGAVLVIVIMNVTVIYSNNDTVTDQFQTEYAATDEYVQLTNSVYEIENIKP